MGDEHKHTLEWTVGASDIICLGDCDFYLHRIEIMKTIQKLESFFVSWEIKEIDDLYGNIVINGKLKDLVKDCFEIMHPKGRE